MMAKGGKIAKDTLFEPERLAARAIAPAVRLQRNDWDPSDRGIHQGAQSVSCNSDAVYMAATDRKPDLTDPPMPRRRHPYMVRGHWQARWKTRTGACHSSY